MSTNALSILLQLGGEAHEPLALRMSDQLRTVRQDAFAADEAVSEHEELFLQLLQR